MTDHQPNYAQYLKFPIPNFDPSNINFDHLGILFGHGNEYFTIVEVTTGQILRSWLTADQIGAYILEEWEDLPKISIGEFGIANEGEIIDGWKYKWHHNTTMSQLREICTATAGEVKAKMDVQAEKRNCKYSAAQFRDVIGVRFTRMLENFMLEVRMQKQQEHQQGVALCDEFIDWEKGEREGDLKKEAKDKEANQGEETKDSEDDQGEEQVKMAVNPTCTGTGRAIWALEEPEVQYKYAVAHGIFQPPQELNSTRRLFMSLA